MIRIEQDYLSFIIVKFLRNLPSSIILCFCLDPSTDHPAHTSRAEQPLVTNRTSSGSSTGFCRDHIEVHISRKIEDLQVTPDSQYLSCRLRGQEREGISTDI